jgi:hypothetical protein
MNELAVSVLFGAASVACVALSWRASSVRRLVLTLAIVGNLGMAQLWSSRADQARVVSWSVSGMLIVVGMLISRRQDWRAAPLIPWGLVAVLLAASCFLTDIPSSLQLALLIALAVTNGVALLLSLIYLAKLIRRDKTTERT